MLKQERAIVDAMGKVLADEHLIIYSEENPWFEQFQKAILKAFKAGLKEYRKKKRVSSSIGRASGS